MPDAADTTAREIRIVDQTAGTEKRVAAGEVPNLPPAPADDPVTRIEVSTHGRQRTIRYLTRSGRVLRRDTQVAKSATK